MTPDRPNPRRPGAFGAAHEDPADAYAGVPILQEPKWHNEIAAYFFFGGISSGAALLGALAGLAGERWRPLARTAQLVSFATMVPCAPLLIVELGRPSRFHHMLRIFKPSSPMNLGTWTLLAHSAFSTLLAARALAEQGRLPVGGSLARSLPSKALGEAGMVPAMTLGGYTGVLLGTTSVPVWSKSPMLGGLFMASAFASGTSAVSLASTVAGRDGTHHAARGTIGRVAGASELALAGGWLATTGPAAKPLLTGTEGALLLGSVTSTVAALALELAGSRSRNRALSALGSVATLAGGAMLRWAVVRAGHVSALDRDANLEAMRSTPENPGWHHV
jgi:formate-dependent nitrite reductase membrane component NrfD